MPVQTPNIEINPYSSTVPTVQVPPQQFGQPEQGHPLQGQFKGHAAGAMAVGDSILKGFIAGHEYKAQKKTAEAQATLAAADAATSAAYQKYQDALSTASGDVKNPQAQAAYGAYQEVFNKGKEAKAKFVIPQEDEKKKKEPKGAKDKVKGLFSNVGEFMQANPHIIPQIALMSMQPNAPGLSPEGKKQQFEQEREKNILAEGKIDLADAERKQGAQKTYDQYSGLSEEQMSALPAAEQAKFQSAKNVLYPPRTTGAAKLYTHADGKTQGWYIPGQEPQGAQPSVSGAAGGTGKIGSESDYAARYARQNGISVADLTTQDLDYIKAQIKHDQTLQSNASTTVHPGVDSTTTTSSRGPGAAPAPPRGRAGFGAPSSPGVMTRPPAASARAATIPHAGGAITRPPAAGSSTNPSPTRVRITQQAIQQKESKIATARQKLNDTLTRNLKITDPTLKKQADDMAHQTFKDEQRGAESGYDQATIAIGGVPGGKDRSKKTAGPPQGATMAYKDKSGVVQGYAVNGVYVPVSQ